MQHNVLSSKLLVNDIATRQKKPRKKINPLYKFVTSSSSIGFFLRFLNNECKYKTNKYFQLQLQICELILITSKPVKSIFWLMTRKYEYSRIIYVVCTEQAVIFPYFFNDVILRKMTFPVFMNSFYAVEVKTTHMYKVAVIWLTVDQ